MKPEELPQANIHWGDSSSDVFVQTRHSTDGLPMEIVIDKGLCQIQIDETEDRMKISITRK